MLTIINKYKVIYCFSIPSQWTKICW